MKNTQIFFMLMSIILILIVASCSMPVGEEKGNPLEGYKYDLTTLEGFRQLIEDPEYLAELAEEIEISGLAVENSELGDVNADGAVDIVDALLVAQYYVGLRDDINVDMADVNLDGAIDIVDALLIAQYYVGLIDSLPPSINVLSALKKITIGDADSEDWFGSSVAISENYAATGAYRKVEDGFIKGAVYILSKDQGGVDNWGQVKKLISNTEADYVSFGYSVAIDGDYVIVGATGESIAGVNGGAAYIFYKDQGGIDNWGEVKTLAASDIENGDLFGFSVDIAGDYAIVGTHDEAGDGVQRGAAYIFYRNQGGTDNWGQIKKLTSDDIENEDWFGTSVAIHEDYAIIGARGKNDIGVERGAAYIFYKDQGGIDNWGQIKKLTAIDAGDYDYFGVSVSIYGDYAIVGADNQDENGISMGAAYIFAKDHDGTDNWGQVKRLDTIDVGAGDIYGSFEVSIYGDYIVVGANGDMHGEYVKGAVYVFYKNQGGENNWGAIQKLTASDVGDDDLFGASISINDNYIIVGAPWQDGTNGSNQGAAYIFNK
jgi:hypothetical protein